MYKSIESKKILSKLYGWQDYGEKHCESIFTDWHIHFYLYEKFGFDKRIAHFSSLINSGQMTRKEAMDLLAECPVYPKLGIENKVMKYPKRSHDYYRKDEKLWKFIATIIRQSKKLYQKLTLAGKHIEE